MICWPLVLSNCFRSVPNCRSLHARPCKKQITRRYAKPSRPQRISIFLAISFLAADLTSTAFNRESGWNVERQDKVGFSALEVDSLDAEMQALMARYSREIENGYIAESPAKLHRIVQHFRAHLGQATPRAPVCNAPWVSAVVAHDGAVQPCFFHAPIGNLHNESLEEIVNGPASLAFRSSLDVATNPICQRCVCSLHLPDGNQP